MPKSEVFCPDIIKMKNDKGIYTESPELPKSEAMGKSNHIKSECSKSSKGCGHYHVGSDGKTTIYYFGLCPECQSQQEINSSLSTESVKCKPAGTDTLKSKICRFEDGKNIIQVKDHCDVIHLADVKEFIRQLKETEFIHACNDYMKIRKAFNDLIDKLSGFGEDL